MAHGSKLRRAPSFKDGKLYAIRSNSAVVDVIDVTDGSITASIPMTSGDDSLTSNVVLTEGHMFVATNNTTYAIDLKKGGYPVVWSAPQGGSLAITPDNQLIIASTTGLYAYSLFCLVCNSTGGGPGARSTKPTPRRS